MFWVGDCETDGLIDEVTKFHCIGFTPVEKDDNRFFLFCDLEDLSNYDQDQFKSECVDPIFFPTEDYLKLLNSPKTTGICLHNVLGYDLPVFRKLSGIEYDWRSINGRPVEIIDSLVWSQYLWPDREIPKGLKGAHGLEAWGVRTGIGKPQVQDWSEQPLSVYLHRMIEDIRINKAAYYMLLKEKNDLAIPNGKKKGQWDLPLKMAHKTRYLMQHQEEMGAVFDVEPKLGERELSKAQQPKFPSQPWKKPFDYKSPFKAKGGLKKPVDDYLD